jgi:SAM-dependent methyltransferase
MDPFPVSLLFRSFQELTEVDRAAVALSRGRVLDVGAGVGAVSLALQEVGRRVTALEIMPEAVRIMARRGVMDPREGEIQDLLPRHAFDTLVLLMNGAALAGSLAALPTFLQALQGQLTPGGQVLMDSTDPFSAWAMEPPESWDGEEEYPGDLQYQLEFQGKRGAPFPQLFLDARTLESVAGREGWRTEVVWDGPEGAYLARLTPVL